MCKSLCCHDGRLAKLYNAILDADALEEHIQDADATLDCGKWRYWWRKSTFNVATVQLLDPLVDCFDTDLC